MKRRDFLITAAAAAGLTALDDARAQTRPRAKLERIAIMGWSFNGILKSPDDPDNAARTLDIMDLPAMYVARYGVHNIEMQQVHFLSTEPEYLREFRSRVESAGSRITQINVEFQASLSAAQHYRRTEAVDLTRYWVGIAQAVRCPRLMVNQGTLEPHLRPAAVDALRRMREYASPRGVMITVENRGANWEATTEVVRAAGVNTNPDLGFPDQEAQLRGLRLMLPYHGGSVHVKVNPERYDLKTALALLKELGYDGLYSIEASSNSPDPYAAVQRIYDELLAAI